MKADRHPLLHKAVLFDLGGVVYDSPFVELFQYEKELSLPRGYFNKVRYCKN